MKYKPLHMAAIFFWPIFTGRGADHDPLGPLLDPLLTMLHHLCALMTEALNDRSASESDLR